MILCGIGYMVLLFRRKGRAYDRLVEFGETMLLGEYYPRSRHGPAGWLFRDPLDFSAFVVRMTNQPLTTQMVTGFGCRKENIIEMRVDRRL